MTVYINGKFLCQQTTGVQSYALHMIEAMKQQDVNFQILTPKLPLLTDTYHVKKIGFFSQLVLWEQLSLPFYMIKQKDAVLLNFCNSAPLLYKEQIVTVHDLAFEQVGVNWFSSAFKYWYRFLVPRICRRARRVLTVSQFSKNELLKFYHLKKEHVEVIPNVIPALHDTAERRIKEDYVLLPGADNPRKNAGWVLQRIAEIERLGLKLVMLTIGSGVFAKQISALPASVICLGYVSAEEYYSLIRYSRAVIYPSLYEGFGLPVLESLCLKKPVICNDLPVFRESFGELPIYLDHKNEECLYEALSKSSSLQIKEEEVEALKAKFSSEKAGTLLVRSLKMI